MTVTALTHDIARSRTTTGLALAVWGMLSFWFGVGHTQIVPMLVTGIGGFELFLTVQDYVLRRRAGGPRG